MNRLDAMTIPKFKNRLVRIPFAKPQIRWDNRNQSHFYEIDLVEFQQQILPHGYPKTTVWGFNTMCCCHDGESHEIDYSPGPMIKAMRNVPVTIRWNNRLWGQYRFPVDPTINWANPKNISFKNMTYNMFPYGAYECQAPVPSVIHLHGGETAPASDGNPMAWWTATGLKGPKYNSNTYTYLNTQQATMLYYHDHSMGVARLNNYTGLLGGYRIIDPQLPYEKEGNNILPTGKFYMPLIIQDKSFYQNGELYYPTMGVNEPVHPYWVNKFYGDTIVVNGRVWPNLDVAKQMYRFSILNGSNTRTYDLDLSNGDAFAVIATDGGYVEQVRYVTSIKIAPSERYDILVDFSNVKVGEKIVLQNSGEEVFVGTTDTVMQFTVIQTDSVNTYNVPKCLNRVPRLFANGQKMISTLFSMQSMDGRPEGMLIDGQIWSNPPSNYVEVGETNDWDFINLTDDMHPMHIHLIQFQVVHRRRFERQKYLNDWLSFNGPIPREMPTRNLDPTNYLTGHIQPPEPYEHGWKDTVRCPKDMVTTVRCRWAPTSVPENGVLPGENKFPFNPECPPGYVFHCHILEHEDNEMMRPLFVGKFITRIR